MILKNLASIKRTTGQQVHNVMSNKYDPHAFKADNSKVQKIFCAKIQLVSKSSPSQDNWHKFH